MCSGWDSADVSMVGKVGLDRCMAMEVRTAQAEVAQMKTMWAAQRTSPVKRAMAH